MTISLAELTDAVGGGAAGVRIVADLEPLGGDFQKVFPPTYGADSTGNKYPVELRRSGNGQEVVSVVLNSVAAQANLHELALLEAVRDGELPLPTTVADFTKDPATAGYGRISDLEAPHRIADAIFRDSLDGDVLFRLGGAGRAVTDATPRNAAGIAHHAPAALLFGLWDSTGPRGGRGAKYERAFTSEITAFGVRTGVKTASRIDPLGIEKKAGPVYRTADHGWTLDQSEAVDGKKAAALDPSDVNHGNIPPGIDAVAGGVTADRIELLSVLSFIQLRRLRFPLDHVGNALPAESVRHAETAARTAIAALGLCASALAFEAGFDLRSRCVLVPKSAPTIELIGRSGDRTAFTLSRPEVLALVADAVVAAALAGLPWREGELVLTPAPQLTELLRRSIGISAESTAGDN